MLMVTYHALAEPASAVSVPARQLEADLAALVEAGYGFVSLDQCADWIEGRVELPARSAVVTFDDGYASVVTRGLAPLSRFGVPATLFVITDRIGRDNRWPGQPRRVPSMPLADVGALRECLAAGLSLGSHTSSHPVLTSLPADALREEVEASADRLEDLVQAPVRHFSYPYGIRGPRELAAVRRRYRTAVTAVPRLVARGADPHDLPRLDCHDLRVAARLRVLASPVLPAYLSVRGAIRRSRRALERVASQEP